MQKDFFETLLGLERNEAERRLREAGADVCVRAFFGKKGAVDAWDEERVVRVRALTEAGASPCRVELLVSAFKTTLADDGER